MIDYAKFDAQRMAYKDSKILTAHKLGFESVHEAIHKTYDSTKSLRKTGKILGFSRTAMRDRLMKMGIKLNTPGGANNAKMPGITIKH